MSNGSIRKSLQAPTTGDRDLLKFNLNSHCEERREVRAETRGNLVEYKSSRKNKLQTVQARRCFPISSTNAIYCIFGIGMTLACLCAGAADWPALGGPDRTGVSPETGLARTWPAGGPRVLWTAEVGEGYGGPAVRDGEVYLLDRVDEAQDIMRCWDLETGKELWSSAHEAPGSTGHSGSRTPPTVDETQVYAVGLMGDLYCFDRKSHALVWHHRLMEDYDVPEVRWGISQSPALYKDLVIVAPQGKDCMVAAFNKRTGEVAWESPGGLNLGYSSPVILTIQGVDQAVMIAASDQDFMEVNDGSLKPGAVIGVSLEDGSVLWRIDGYGNECPIPYATLLPDNRLFITGGYDAGSIMLQIRRDGGTFMAKQLFHTNDLGSQIQQPILYQDLLYANSNTNSVRDGMVCMDLDGNRIWCTKDIEGAPNFDKGSLILADDMIYFLDGKTGILHLIEPSPAGYKELAQAELIDSKKIWAPLALSQGKLLLRGQETLKCIDVKNP